MNPLAIPACAQPPTKAIVPNSALHATKPSTKWRRPMAHEEYGVVSLRTGCSAAYTNRLGSSTFVHGSQYDRPSHSLTHGVVSAGRPQLWQTTPAEYGC